MDSQDVSTKLDFKDPFEGGATATAQTASSVPLDFKDPFAAPAPAAAPKPQLQRSLLGNLGESALGAAVTGAGQVVRGVGDIGQKLDNLTGIQPRYLTPASIQSFGQRVEDTGQAESQDVTPAFKRATSMGITDPGGFTATNIANKAINSVAGMAPALAGSLVPGVGPVLGTAAFASQGEASGQEEGQQQVAALNDTQIQAVPRYQELLRSGLAPDAARAQLSSEVANRQSNIGAVFGGALGAAGKIPGVEALGNAAGGVLTRAIGKTAAPIVGKSLAEGVGFGGINAAGQVANNLGDQVPTSPTQGVGEAFASGLLPGAVLGFGHALLHRAAPPFPGAESGSLADAANTLHQTTQATAPAPAAAAAAPEAAAPASPRAAATAQFKTLMETAHDEANTTPDQRIAAREQASQIVRDIAAGKYPGPDSEPLTAQEIAAKQAQAQQWPQPTWLNTSTGEVRTPSDEELKAQLHVLADAKEAGGGGGLSGSLLSNLWDVPASRIKALSQDVRAERTRGVTTADAFGQIQPEQADLLRTPTPAAPETQASEPQAAETPEVSDKANPNTPENAPAEQTPAEKTAAASQTAAESETTKEEPTHGLEQPAQRPAPLDESDAAGRAGEPPAQGEGAAAAEAAGSGAGEAGAAGTGRDESAAVPVADTTDLEHGLTKTDRATGPDGATYMVKENNNGEGYHVTRSEDGSSTQHRSEDPAQPWTREQAVSAAGQLARERAASAAESRAPAAPTPEAAPRTEPAGEPGAETQPPKPSVPESAQAGPEAAAGEDLQALATPKAENEPETTPKTPEVQPTATEQPSQRQQIDQGFADNKAAIAQHGFKAGDRVTFTNAVGRTVEGTIANGDRAGLVKDMGVFEVEHPGRSGATTTSTVGARHLTKLEAPEAPSAQASILAKPTGYPAGGWHAVDESGNVLKRASAKDGDLAPRFKTAEAADAFARKQIAARSANEAAKTPVAAEKTHGQQAAAVEPVRRVGAAAAVADHGEGKAAEPVSGKASVVPGAIEDFGEKLGGARKDEVRSVDRGYSDDDIENQPLSKIWPTSEIDNTKDTFVAAVAHAARAEIPAKPRVASKVRRWASRVQIALDVARAAEHGKLTQERLAEKFKDLGAKVKLLQGIDRTQWNRIGEVKEHPTAYTYGPDGEHIPKPQVMVSIDGRWQRFEGAKNVTEALPEIQAKLGAPVVAKALQFEIRGNQKRGDYFINKNGDSEYRRLKSFTDLAEARAYLKDNHDDLVNAWEAVKDRDNVTKADMRNANNRARVGPDYRDGKDVAPEQFGDAFGFRGVEFGNWVKQGGNAKERQGLLNQAYDGLMDLANLIGVPPRAMSLDGTLGLGLGSRGHGRASAHYEPDKLVINLTKTRGAGALAHEWFHALDNYFARSRGAQEFKGSQEAFRKGAFVTYRPEPMMVNERVPAMGRITRDELMKRHAANPGAKMYDPSEWKEDPNHPAGVRPVVEKAFADLVKTLNESPMHQRALSIDNGKEGGYWSRIVERAARSFENYVIARMDEKGITNDYLANVRKLEAFARDPAQYPYLKPEEVKPVAEAFDNLFKTVETRTGENGNVALFSKAQPGQPVRFTPDASLVRRMGAFIDQAAIGKVRPTDTYILGNTPDVLVETGAPNIGLEMEGDAALKVLSGKHSDNGITPAQLKSLPERLADPLAVFESKTQPGEMVVLTELTDRRGRGVIAAVHLGKRSGRGLVNRIESIHPRDNAELEQWGAGGFLRYYNDEALAQPTTGPLQLGKVVQAAEGLGKSILTKSEFRNSGFSNPENAQPEAGRSTSSGIDQAHAQHLVDQATAKWGDEQPNVRVLASAEELPDSAKRDADYKGSEGYYDGKNVYLIAPNLRSEARVQQVLAHEAIGHYGVDRIVNKAFGADAWGKLTASITRLDQEGLGSDAMKGVLAEVRRRYPDADADTFAKETVAVMAERGVRNGILDRVVAAVRKYLRQIMPHLKINEAELRQLLVKSDRFLRTGEKYSDRLARTQAQAFSNKADPFYSALTESVGRAQGAPKSGTAEQWKQWLDGAQRRGEFKQSEREWMGIDPFLDEHKGPITRADMQEFARENQVQLQEVTKRGGSIVPEAAADLQPNDEGGFDVVDEGGNAVEPQGNGAGEAKFGEYTLPGGENYREMLLTLPAERSDVAAMRDKHQAYADRIDRGETLAPAEAADYEKNLAALGNHENPHLKAGATYTSSHFDEPNILAHVRMNDRTGPDGEKILHVEEVQSDWHQAGRKQGYNAEQKMPDGTSRTPTTGVPDAPFKKEWPLLAMKRVLHMAAEQGYDKVTWTTGEQQAARYGLSKQVDAVRVMPASRSDAVHVMVKSKGDREFHSIGDTSAMPKDQLADVLGKDLAQKALRDTANGDVADYSGVDLKIGGEGMSGFYDRLLPNEVNKYVKQWGAKVGESEIETKPARELRNEFDLTSLGQPAPTDNSTRTEPAVMAKVHSIDINPAMRESVLQGQPMFSKPESEQPRAPGEAPRVTLDGLGEALAKPDGNAFERATAWIRGKSEDLRPAALAFLQTRHLLELMEHYKPLAGYGKEYGRSMQQLDADRTQLMAGASDAAERPKDMLAKGAAPIADAWRKFAYEKGPAGWLGREKPEAKALSGVMHDATVFGLDPAEEYKRLMVENAHGDQVPWTKEAIKHQIEVIREQMRGRPGDDKSLLMDEVKRLRNLPKREKLREARWPELVQRYQALPEEAKAIYTQVRDWYTQYRDATEQALIRNIEQMNLPETYRRSLQNRMRLRFEEARRDGVYFPLNRDGDYWISFADHNGDQGFKMFESAKDARAAEKKLRAAGYTIDAQGRRDNSAKAKDAPSGTFVREVIDILQKAHASEKVQDEVYQTFLKALPEMSMRKHSVHRKNIAGFSEDALRAFAKNGFHGAHQLARLRHAQDMQTTIDAAQATMDAHRRGDNLGNSSTSDILDVAKGDAMLGELKKRHQWIMSPTDAQLANVANAIGFTYYLGASPASALTNLTQVVQTTLPVLGAQHGWGKATRALGAAWQAAARTGGHIERTLTDPDERRAFNTLMTRGDFTRTQQHTLAGQAEGNALQSNPAWNRTMNAIGWMFQKAEVINRESTGLAAYRLARARGDDFNKAVQYASDIVNGTQFDYCVDTETECLTLDGWKRYDQISETDTVIAMDDDGRAVESAVRAVNVFTGQRQVIEFDGSPRRFSMVVTPHHGCVVQNYSSRDKKWRRQRIVDAARMRGHDYTLRTTLQPIKRDGCRYGEDFSALLGWIAAEGQYARFRNCKTKRNVRLAQSQTHNPAYVAEIDALLERLGGHSRKFFTRAGEMIVWTLRKPLSERVLEAMPEKRLTFEMLRTMTASEMAAVTDAFAKGDGNRRESGTWAICQKNTENRINLDVLQAMAAACAMPATMLKEDRNRVALNMHLGKKRGGRRTYMKLTHRRDRTVDTVWCPTTEHGTWIARRNGAMFVTGNSSANRPRVMQGNALRIALQFKNYSIGMTWLFYRNLFQAMKGETPEIRRVARRTVTGMLATTALLAGTTGLPIYNAVKMAGNAANAVFGNNDEPFDFDAEYHAWLADHFGNEAANLIATGPTNELTGANLANRTSMANLWFQDADRNLEGADAYHALLEALAGPMGGITKNFYVGAQDVRQGNVERGIETMLPTAAKNSMKALRFAHDGANSLRGDPILPDVSAPQDFIQAIGFQPTALAQQQKTNDVLKNYEQFVLDRRQTLMNAYAMALHTGSGDDLSAAMDAIRTFNGDYPQIALSAKSMRASLRTRARYSAQAQSGIFLNRKLAAGAREFAGVDQGSAPQ